jgi:hypothetical protein
MENNFLSIINFLNNLIKDVENYINKRNDILCEIEELSKDYPDILEQVKLLLTEIYDLDAEHRCLTQDRAKVVHSLIHLCGTQYI